ncbi:cyanuric acid amidohydrolase [Paenibacillus sp. 598K]|uniref:cyanuric acid amidohydrolase n=1 Tax=Paenibacillus sp. 598K TaxID=1117987 RepID=UPI000FFF650B|nr:ring-opening amidohydrolase [Paenibacillus sp. 598K]
MRCTVIKVESASPSDTVGLRRLVEEGALRPQDVVAVLGKTEGNGCVNDFTRGYATQALKAWFAGNGGSEAISYVMSGGTEGILSPHFTVVSRTAGGAKGVDAGAGDGEIDGAVGDGEWAAGGGVKSLAIGTARTPSLQPEELGRLAQVEHVATAVKRAMAEAGIAEASDVHFVQIKCPLLTAVEVYDAQERGCSTVTEDTYKSMGYSRGASALGAALALGEIDGVRDEDICHAWELYSEVASTSAGSELDYCEVVVFGNSAAAEGPQFIDHEVMTDAIDGAALSRMLQRHPEASVVQVLAKAEADPTGYVRGRRHTMLNDSDINHTRHARAVVGGVLASLVGDPMIYVSGGAEHQGPAGGGPVAVIFTRAQQA